MSDHCLKIIFFSESDDEDENKDTNLLPQASDKFEHSQLASAACSTTSAALFLAAFNTMTTAIATLPVPRLHFRQTPFPTSSSLGHFAQSKNDAEIANEKSRGIPKTMHPALTFRRESWGEQCVVTGDVIGLLTTLQTKGELQHIFEV